MIGGEGAGEGEQIGGEVMGEGVQNEHTTKCLVFAEAKSKGSECQRKGDKGFTIEERVTQKFSEEVAFQKKALQ